jgi:hypothetical protein
VKWSGIGTPKNLGGWGLKNIFHFTQSLAAWSLWRLILNNGIWFPLGTKGSDVILCSLKQLLKHFFYPYATIL